MRVLYPDLKAVWPGLANPHEASYAVAALTLLPNGLVGIMLAAMFSATMSSLSGLFNMHAAVVSKDIYQTLFAQAASEKELLVVGWVATFGVGATMTALAMGMAAKGASIFSVMLTFNTVMSLAYGPPALLGLVVEAHAELVGARHLRGGPGPRAATARSSRTGASCATVLVDHPAPRAPSSSLSALLRARRPRRTARGARGCSAVWPRPSTSRASSATAPTAPPRSSAS